MSFVCRKTQPAERQRWLSVGFFVRSHDGRARLLRAVIRRRRSANRKRERPLARAVVVYSRHLVLWLASVG